MQRPLTAMVGLAAVVLAVWVVLHNYRAPKPTGYGPATHSSPDDGGALVVAMGDAASPSDDGGALVLTDLVQGIGWGSGTGMTLSDRSPVPPLPFTAPRQVRFGIVLVSFNGAQPSPGMRMASRSMSDAKTLADKLMATAAQDFHGAVLQGDPGSAEDIGRVRVGVLEPAPEYVLFTLPVGGVGGPVETPRGYWIVKRLE